jgi:hypothetical protein
MRELHQRSNKKRALYILNLIYRFNLIDAFTLLKAAWMGLFFPCKVCHQKKKPSLFSVCDSCNQELLRYMFSREECW